MILFVVILYVQENLPTNVHGKSRSITLNSILEVTPYFVYNFFFSIFLAGVKLFFCFL